MTAGEPAFYPVAIEARCAEENLGGLDPGRWRGPQGRPLINH